VIASGTAAWQALAAISDMVTFAVMDGAKTMRFVVTIATLGALAGCGAGTADQDAASAGTGCQAVVVDGALRDMNLRVYTSCRIVRRCGLGGRSY